MRDRIRAVIMIAKKWSSPKIADALDFSLQGVKKLAIDSTRDVLEGLRDKPRKMGCLRGIESAKTTRP